MNQIDDNMRRALPGNVGTIISFSIGMEDAMHIAKEMCTVPIIWDGGEGFY
jgi:hypothetical protein